MLQPDVTEALDQVHAGATADSTKSQVLDFKTVGRSISDALTDLAEAAVCFANAQGGTIVVGVRDKAQGPEAFVESPLDPTRTISRIYELTEPSLIVIVENIPYAGKTLTGITVPQSPDIHQVKGVATERVGTSCKRMTASKRGNRMSSMQTF